MSADVIDFKAAKRRLQVKKMLKDGDLELRAWSVRGCERDDASVGVMPGADLPVILMLSPAEGLRMSRKDALALGGELMRAATSKLHLP